MGLPRLCLGLGLYSASNREDGNADEYSVLKWIVSGFSGCWAFGKRDWGATATASGYGVSFWGDENVMELDSGRDCTTLQIP